MVMIPWRRSRYSPACWQVGFSEFVRKASKITHLGDAPPLSLPHSWTAVVLRLGRTSISAPPRKGWIPLRKSTPLLAAMAVAMILAFLYGCQADKQEGSGSSKTAAQDKTAEQTGQTQGGELGEAQGARSEVRRS